MNLEITGGQVLEGEVTPSGSKNSAVAIIPATLLFDRPVTLTNIPEITDVTKLVAILSHMGSRISWNHEASSLTIDNSSINPDRLSQLDLANIRATSLLWGPLLGRFRTVPEAHLPGGCTLGNRPMDAHFQALADLGAALSPRSSTSVTIDATRAKPGEIWLSEMSPTATENALTLAVTLPGTTTLVGAASEPQVQDLCHFLSSAGAEISGVGSSTLNVRGPAKLQETAYEILPDHNEIATFLALGAATQGAIKVHRALPHFFPTIARNFARVGTTITYAGDTATHHPLPPQPGDTDHPTVIRGQPWPGLPVDILPLFVPLALSHPGHRQFLFHNWMYEAGLLSWAQELAKFGTNLVMCDPHRLLVTSGSHLTGAEIEAPYIIRAAVALTMTAMIAEGQSKIVNADALYRGHPNFAQNLRSLGAKIEEIT